MRYLFFFLLLIPELVFSNYDENYEVKRIHAHLLIRDYSTATRECEKALLHFPESKDLQRALILALAESGKDEEAIVKWKEWRKKTEKEDHDLLETIAWGILNRTENSPQFAINTTSLLSAFFTQDVRAVKILKTFVNSQNAILRAGAVQLSASYHDATLIQEIKRLLQEEKIWFVRHEVIKALGNMQILECREDLKKIISHSRSGAEEKAVAITALVSMYDRVDTNELEQLIRSKRAGLRQLACQVVAHLDLKSALPSIIEFLADTSPDVRIAALNTLYLVGLKHLPPNNLEKIVELMGDHHPTVSITSAWVAMRSHPTLAKATLRKWVYSSDESSRRLAAYLIACCGSLTEDLIIEVLKMSSDPFVKANLALGMIGHTSNIKLAAETLYSFLLLNPKKIMKGPSGNPLFSVLAPTEMRHTPQTQQYPMLIDQQVRLEIYSILAKLEFAKAEEAIKTFLKNQILGITFAAGSALLQEGGIGTLEILKTLLQEPNEMVRIQAAFVLALSGKEEEAIEVMQKGYLNVDREMKMNILGALGQIGDKTSVPFLIGLLDEPYQALRVVAASALIQCLYH
mgnify:CR=1 FL=1